MELKSSGLVIRRAGIFGAALFLFSAGEAAAATTHCVNPGGTGGCFASVQQAVNAAGAGDTIDVAAGTYAENVVATFPKRVTINGAGSGATTISGDGSAAVVTLDPGTRVSLSGLRIEGGAAGMVAQERSVLRVSACEITANAIGIVVGVGARGDVSDSAITGNGPPSVSAFASGIDSLGTLNVAGTTVSGNTGSSMAIRSNRRLTLTGSTVSGNDGTGIELNRRATISRSTISGNTGGGVLGNFQPQVKISDTTISGNSTPFSAGGLGMAGGQATLDRVTIAGNSAGAAGGGIATFSSGKFRIRSSIIADNVAATGNDCASSALRAVGVNLIEDTGSCAITGGLSALIVADPLLGPLQDNGGATETQALSAGSPALAVLTVGAACNQPDQRGVARAVPCDLGAFEAP